MPPFRKGGSFVRFFVDGEGEVPADDAFLVALARQRFRTIEGAANEGTSAGWVSPSDPSGQDFDRDEILAGPYVRLRLRIDRKRLPPAWVAIGMSAEIRARGGRGVSAKERKEIRAEVAGKILPRILPSVRLVDVVWVRQQRMVLLFSTSPPVAAECAKLFLRTWGLRLVDADPTNLALRAGLPADQLRSLEKIQPFSLEADRARWEEAMRRAPAPGEAEEATA